MHLTSKRPILPEGVDRQDPIELAKGQARSLRLCTAEAVALRLVLMEVSQNRDYPVIVMGGFNDETLSRDPVPRCQSGHGQVLASIELERSDRIRA